MIPAGLQDGSIRGEQFSASSSHYNVEYCGRCPWYARLHNDNFWAVLNPTANSYHWIQIDLLSAARPIIGIQTQGSTPETLPLQWVETLQVETGNDSTSLKPIMESGIIKVVRLNLKRNNVLVWYIN